MSLPRVEPGPTVVVCEDDAPTLELLCDHLEADRFCALPAPSAADALRLCHYNHPDLLLLDLNLPDASGLDVLREIRATDGATGSYDPELPVIVLSGRGTDADRIRGLDCGADDYVVKPFAIGEVVARIRVVLRRRDGRRGGPLRVGEIFVDPVAARGHGRRRAGEAREQGVQPPAHARRRAAPGVHQGRAAARRLGLSLDGPHADARLARQPAAAQARPASRAATSSTAGASATA